MGRELNLKFVTLMELAAMPTDTFIKNQITESGLAVLQVIYLVHPFRLCIWAITWLTFLNF